MDYVFEITDKSGRKIHLSKERWNEHIKLEHPNIMNTDELELTLKNPDKIIKINGDINHYYKHFKHKNYKSKYLKIVVKYLNQHGFVITAYFVRNIRIK
jgi:hypothetical protein